MSTYYYGPALDSEVSYRRDGLLRDAAAARLARQARTTRRARRAAGRTAPVIRPVPAPVEAPAPAGSPLAAAGDVRDQAARAA